MRIDHLNFNVSNLEKSVAFYTELFGLEVKETGVAKSGAPYKIIGHPKRFYLCLYQNKQHQETDFNHFGVHVDDFESIVKKVNDLNIEIQYGGLVDWEKSKSAYILGPDGEEIEITEKFGGDLN